MSKTKKQNVTITTCGNKVIVESTVNGLHLKGEASCHFEDKFNFFTGFEIAYKRMRASEDEVRNQKTINDKFKSKGIKVGDIVEVSNNGISWCNMNLLDIIIEDGDIYYLAVDSYMHELDFDDLYDYAEKYKYCRKHESNKESWLDSLAGHVKTTTATYYDVISGHSDNAFNF